MGGHPSAVGRVQDRESSPVKERRSTTVPRNQVGRLLMLDVILPSRHATDDYLYSQHCAYHGIKKKSLRCNI